ncbi:MAG: sigma-70 family RNA polymerase sigma factor [Proteobacteria bacterium]|nr:sigma-70 family RNA polymerase sigma factor [Pseudomonadota bacterium]NOG60198.1 sigma-70 family RNA polymerase sigma factor [Pseudomonadota bacterium]
MQDAAKQYLKQYCKDADNVAFAQFYRSESSRLWQFLKNRGCDEDAAYDLLSETFLKFIQVVCKDLRAPVSLLYRISINLHIDSFRRNKVSPVDQFNIDIEQQPDQNTEYQNQQDYVESIIKSLPQDEQNLLFMRYRVGLTHKEIANMLELPQGTVRRQCATILNKLKQQWQEDANDA